MNEDTADAVILAHIAGQRAGRRQVIEAIRNIVASSDANDGDSLANAINAARELLTDEEATT